MFEEAGETTAERRERLRRQRKEFIDFVNKDLEDLRRQRPPRKKELLRLFQGDCKRSAPL